MLDNSAVLLTQNKDFVVKLLGFLVKKFDKMPKVVRVITYLIFLSLILLFTLCTIYLGYLEVSHNINPPPKFAFGEFRETQPDRTFDKLPGIFFEVKEGGHNFKLQSDDAGNWAIPIPDQRPHDVVIDVQYPNSEHKRYSRIKLKQTDLFFKSPFPQVNDKYFTIEINSDSIFLVALESKRSNLSERIRTTLVNSTFLLPSSAFAGELKLPKTMKDCTLSIRSKDSIRVEVSKTVSEALGVALLSISDNTSLKVPPVSYGLKTRIIKKLEKNFKINIPAEHWQNLNTVGELNAYLQNRQILQNYLEGEMQGNRLKEIPTSWPDIQMLFPSTDAPFLTSP